MSCEALRDLVWTVPDGGLAADDQQRLEEHLKGCGECRARVAAARAVTAAMKRLPTEAAPVGFRDRTLAAMAEGVAGAAAVPAAARLPPPRLVRRLVSWSRGWPLVAAAAVVLLFVILRSVDRRSKGEPAAGLLAARDESRAPELAAARPPAAAERRLDALEAKAVYGDDEEAAKSKLSEATGGGSEWRGEPARGRGSDTTVAPAAAPADAAAAVDDDGDGWIDAIAAASNPTSALAVIRERLAEARRRAGGKYAARGPLGEGATGGGDGAGVAGSNGTAAVVAVEFLLVQPDTLLQLKSLTKSRLDWKRGASRTGDTSYDGVEVFDVPETEWRSLGDSTEWRVVPAPEWRAAVAEGTAVEATAKEADAVVKAPPVPTSVPSPALPTAPVEKRKEPSGETARTDGRVGRGAATGASKSKDAADSVPARLIRVVVWTAPTASPPLSTAPTRKE